MRQCCVTFIWAPHAFHDWLHFKPDKPCKIGQECLYFPKDFMCRTELSNPIVSAIFRKSPSVSCLEFVGKDWFAFLPSQNSFNNVLCVLRDESNLMLAPSNRYGEETGNKKTIVNECNLRHRDLLPVPILKIQFHFVENHLCVVIHQERLKNQISWCTNKCE